jgi:hypothetical protein
MAHAQRAHALQDEFEAATGIRPQYPRSRIALQGLRKNLDRYIAVQDAVKVLDAQRQAVKDEADEFAQLAKMDVIDDFDLDQPTTAGKLEGEPARLLKRAKGAHRREGAVHVFSTWRQEEDDPYDLGDVKVNGKIRVTQRVASEAKLSSSATMATPGGLTSTSRNPVKSTYTRATYGGRSKRPREMRPRLFGFSVEGIRS